MPGETVISLGRRLPGASSGQTREPHAGRASPVLAGRIALLLGLAPGGVYRAGAVTRVAGELLPHRFTLTALADGGLFSVALCRGVAPPGRKPAPCPAEPGLSSRASCPTPATVQPSLVRIKERVEARGSIAPGETRPPLTLPSPLRGEGRS